MPPERPILFSAPMARAIRDGRKTQTRRVVKPRDLDAMGWEGHALWLYHADGAPRPYGVPGDLLWIRERCWIFGRWREEGVTKTGRRRWRFKPIGRRVRFENPNDDAEPIAYLGGRSGWSYRNSIHMPRWASRITLRITDVRVERLQDISEADARAEGCSAEEDPDWRPSFADPDSGGSPTFVKSYRALWDHINGPGSWDANPWVWVVAFEVVTPSSLTPAPQGDAEGGVLGQHGMPSKAPAPALAPDQPQKLGDVAADAVARLAGGVDAP
jgi:hypothetical protein